ncbi:hypothetical protein [Phycicoccus sp. Soil803]|uniref:hypothetical protein n=1 Tax=Phycicoccus sp. Soil803 TaxID=1736415 RepID=UPI0007096F9B|nr:hypothetical protein [Phycicoccus sp. Soil803]KRF23647.1 hypothetical protein ASG95_02905 [Phycicoccus sp. Soil803]
MTLPEDIPLKPGSTLRFRVSDPERGLESSTWSLAGSKRSGDLYIGGREIMSALKFSLHESGITRMAWTSEGAVTRVPPGEDRMISRWETSEPLPAGWRVGMRMTISDSALSPMIPPLETAKVRPIRHLPPPGRGHIVDVRVLLGEPAGGGIRVEGEMEEVGRMMLGDGTRVFVVATTAPTSPEREAQLVAIRTLALAAGAADRPVPRAFAWGTDDATGVPVLIDAGDPRPPEDRPALIPRYDGPADVWVGKMLGE